MPCPPRPGRYKPKTFDLNGALTDLMVIPCASFTSVMFNKAFRRCHKKDVSVKFTARILTRLMTLGYIEIIHSKDVIIYRECRTK